MILINTFKNNRYQAGLTGYVVRIFKNNRHQARLTGYVVRIFKNTRYQHLVTGYVARIFYLLKASSNKRLKQQAPSTKHVAGCQVLALDNLGL
tara:strand:+ start:30 stop:308 length:279 start_codon:yes stop_codon:yes gene_type:complete